MRLRYIASATGPVAMILAIVLVLLVAGSLLFHFLTPWYFTPIASNWGTIDDTIGITFWITGFVFVAVNLFVAYCVVRFRHRKGRRAALRTREQEAGMVAHRRDHRGRRRHAGARLVRMGEFRQRPGRRGGGRGRGPAVALALSLSRERRRSWVPPMPGTSATKSLRHGSGRSRWPGRHAGVEPGTASAAEQADQGAVALRGRPAQLRRAAVPGQDGPGAGHGHLSSGSPPPAPGQFDLLCNELCGVAHYAMRGKVVVEEEQPFQAWLARLSDLRADHRRRPPGDAARRPAALCTCARPAMARKARATAS